MLIIPASPSLDSSLAATRGQKRSELGAEASSPKKTTTTGELDVEDLRRCQYAQEHREKLVELGIVSRKHAVAVLPV